MEMNSLRVVAALRFASVLYILERLGCAWSGYAPSPFLHFFGSVMCVSALWFCLWCYKDE
ncbi:hypothetical protein GH5_03153 [Leishmania sp. Ghana 2012 LV757]|uniref:hypothetical protein n=1 Tax=Leishmania sp. Ghana 2012 LV757 TaxID=2803181 RepID=UPI001B79C5EB|nr:hypothetical protein GH5_03153 [Leishmania sp. Ghana 2012 LV757]